MNQRPVCHIVIPANEACSIISISWPSHSQSRLEMPAVVAAVPADNSGLFPYHAGLKGTGDLFCAVAAGHGDSLNELAAC